jgi:cation/acetate symporter
VLSVGFVFLIAQLVGAGVLLNALTGIGFELSVLLTGGSMLLYVVFGGMLATTWVQIVKALILGATTLALTIWVCGRVGFNPLSVITGAADRHPAGEATFGPGVAGASPINVISGTLAFALGSAALPHILVRFFTVPDGDQARKSMGWTLAFVGIICIVTSVLGFGTRLVLGDGPAAAEATASGGTLAVPLMAQELGGGPGTAGGDLMLAFVTAVAFATILAVVAGLVISGSGAAAHDIWTMVVRRGQGSDREQALVARAAAAGLGVIGITLAILAGPGLNTAFLVGLALSVSAAGVFPALLLALSWRRFNTVGAVAGVATGLVASLIMIVLSPSVWPGPEADAPVQLNNPALVTVPLAFLACWIGTLAGGHRVERRSFAELLFRSETGWSPT